MQKDKADRAGGSRRERRNETEASSKPMESKERLFFWGHA